MPICSSGLKPGTDTALFSGLLVHLADNGALDRDYIERHTTGFDDALARARSIAGSVGATALATGLSEQDVATFFQMFANTPRVVTLYSQGVNQSAQGTDKVNAIINCHLATGRIGKPGASPFSLTGQPNAMGGREVGGLANQLAAHMGFTPPDIDRVRRFWKAPRIATHEGLKAVQMFEAIARGEIKALWVMGTNPAVSLPNADAVREALKKLELFVVSENVRLQRHGRCRRACAAAGAGLGREIRHRDQFGAAHLAAARVPAAARRGAGRIGGSWARSPSASVSARPSTSTRRRIFSASTPRSRRSRTTAARDFDIGALAVAVGRAISTRWRRCSGRSGRDASRRRASSPRAASSPTIARRASSRRKFRRCAPRPRRRGRCGSTPAASATSGTP